MCAGNLRNPNVGRRAGEVPIAFASSVLSALKPTDDARFLRVQNRSPRPLSVLFLTRRGENSGYTIPTPDGSKLLGFCGRASATHIQEGTYGRPESSRAGSESC